MDKKIEKVIKNLQNNNINVVFAENTEKVREIVKDMLFQDADILSGGSVSLVESGVFDIITSSKYNYHDRLKQGLTEEEKNDIFKKVIGCDFYFCSANALTENGELINVDGFSNRISAISFGPKKVVMVVGLNKLVKDIDEGFLRVKKIAAPKNAMRLKRETPCVKLGHCVCLEKTDTPQITDGCNSEQRICRNYIISSKQMIKDRITVILCAENLGY